MTTRRALVWCYDLDGAKVDAIGHGFLDLYTDERLGQSEELYFELAADHPKAGRLLGDADLEFDNRFYFIDEKEERRRGSQPTIAVRANASWYRLGGSTFVGSMVINDHTPHDGLAVILDTAPGWTTDDAATSTSADTFSMEQQDRSLLELLRTWARITGLFLRFDTAARTVALTETAGGDVGLSFRYGRNLTGTRRRLRPPDVTRLFPYGADDLTIAGANGGIPYVEDLSYYTDQGIDLDAVRPDGLTNREHFTRSKVWTDRSFIRDVDLLPAAEARLADLAGEQVSYELEVVDISELTGVRERARIGETVRAYDPDFAVDVRTIVTRRRNYPLQPWRNQLELSTSPNPIGDGSTSSRPQLSNDWEMFTGRIRADYTIRNDGDFVVASIPVRFRDGGRAGFHLSLWGTGVGAGNLVVTVIDANADPDEQQWRTMTIPYTDGAPFHLSTSWSAEELEGSKFYRVRVTTEATGGASGLKGVNIAEDRETPLEASFWILAQGAVQETPTLANSVVFDYTGAVQEWTVPDNVTGPITIECNGAEGGGTDGDAVAGRGALVIATFPTVIPGTVYDVYVGGAGTRSTPGAGWPNGGNGGDTPSSSTGGGGGGGSSDVRPDGAGLADALIVAAGGGGTGEPSVSHTAPNGGDGGYEIGGTGVSDDGLVFAAGATQSAGGSGNPGGDGSFNQGGAGNDAGSAFRFSGGGGGGGWYGGEGGPADSVVGSIHGMCGGGGGSSHVSAAAVDLEFADGARSGHGQITISWETPIN